MRSVVIVGAGELGGALARQVGAADVVGRVVLVDHARTVAEGKALDITQAAAIDGYSTVLRGTNDESAALGADAIVIADGADSREWQGDDAVALVRRLSHLNETAILLCAGAGQMDLVERGVGDLGIPRQRLLGSAPEALRAAIVSMTALEADCSPTEISLVVVGRPPTQIIVPWDDASIGGRRAVDVLSPPAITRLDGRLRRLWPPGPLTLASAATRVIAAAATRGRGGLSAFVAITREEGDRGHVAMLPVMVGPGGLSRVLMPTLSARDRVRFDTAFHR